MTREEAIERFENVKASALVQKASGVSEYWQNEIDGTIKAIDMAIEALSAEPTVIRSRTLMPTKDFKEWAKRIKETNPNAVVIPCDAEVASAEAEWIPCSERLPSEEDRYMVTHKAFSDMTFIDLFYYGKPSMPNCKVKGWCWYRSDDEYGDVVYEDSEILAWMPLPEPYREESEVEE